jgi:hypothetical protein
MPNEHSHVLKIKRAYKHLEDLDSAVKNWVGLDDNTISRLEPNPDNAQELLLKASAREIPLDPFSLIVGEAVHNMRSSLDCIAFALAKTFSKPFTDEMAHNSQFPIVGDVNRKGIAGTGHSSFASQKAKCIGGIDPQAQAIIETLQPYQAGPGWKAHPLMILAELSNADKHRLVHVSIAAVQGLDIAPFPEDNWDDRGQHAIVLNSGFITNDTVVARINIEELYGCKPETDVKIKPNLSLAFADGFAVGKLLDPVFVSIYSFILREVFGKLSPFL